MPLSAELPFAFYAIAAFVMGLMVGSFLNVVIWRIPRGESIVFPGSHCGNCGNPVKPYDNIPLISYAVLRGKCRACKTHFSFVYPAVELMTGVIFLAIVNHQWTAWRNLLISWDEGTPPTFSLLAAIASMIIASVLIALTFIDARHQLLPNVITWPSWLFALVTAGLLEHGAGESATSPATVLSSQLQLPLSQVTVVIGALLLAGAVPFFWLIDWLDQILFDRYFADEEPVEFTPEEEAMEAARERQHSAMVRFMLFAGIVVAVVWIALNLFGPRIGVSPGQLNNFSQGLLNAWIGALIGGGIIWLLRAAYFLVRKIEGMGLGDVKLMAVIGAFLGWQSAFLVIVIGSLIGSIVGLALARRSADGLKTALPFGVFLGPAAILVMICGQSLINWYLSHLH